MLSAGSIRTEEYARRKEVLFDCSIQPMRPNVSRRNRSFGDVYRSSSSGTVRRNRKVQVRIPAGVDTGSKVRLSGRGERGYGGGEPGDLVITFRVKSDRFFRRKGLDVYCTVPINVAQATLGTKIRVRTVDGKKVVLRIPPGTQSGTAFRIRGQGVEKEGRRGDQLVRVKVEVPDELSEKGREAAEELAEAEGLKH